MLAILLGLFSSVGLAALAGGLSSSGSPKPVVAKEPVKPAPVDPIIDDTDDDTADDDTGDDDPGDDDTGPDDGHHDDTGDDTGGGHDDDTGHDDGHDDDTGDGGHDDDGHGDHDDVVVLPVTAAEIEAFVKAVKDAPETHVHDHGTNKAGEHEALLDLVPRDEATHIAIGNGSWFDPDNWYQGKIPDADAKVLIPEGVTLTYDEVSDVRLFTVRVDGKLDFAHDTDSKMVVDTFVVSPSGHLQIGTEDMPIDADVDVDIVIANNGAIDTDWDQNLLSRGLISHGKATIHGAAKDSHEKVIDDPMAGDTSISFEEIPVGWQVGDTIVIAGTHYDGYTYNGPGVPRKHNAPEDEVRVITEINGDTVHFEEPLIHDHDTPRDDLFTSVANYTRNVSISTEDPDTAEIHERGHAMFMHSDDVDIRYAEFHELGRTDKSELAKDAGDFDTIAFDTNVKGRYGLHLHRLGTDDVDDPAIVIGNSVYGSPGWGFVHHDSNALLDNNASYDTFGAGFVAESGNEIGTWSDNISIFSQGISWASTKTAITTREEIDEFDFGRSGDGFWFQGRMVASEGNIAASVNHGFVYFHRGPTGDEAKLPVDATDFLFPEAYYFDKDMPAGKIPILEFTDNEAFAAKQGLQIVKANPNQGNDIHSIFDGFTAWSVKSGAHFEYTAHYVIKDFDVIARDPGPGHKTVWEGISFGNNTYDMIVIDSTIEGFSKGISLGKKFTDNIGATSETTNDFVIINTDISVTGETYVGYDPAEDIILDTLPDAIAPSLDLDPLVYKKGALDHQFLVEVSGTKTDGIGATGFPSGADNFKLTRLDVNRVVEQNGYYTASDGHDYFTMDFYFSDRLTGDIYKQAAVVKVGDDVPALDPAHHKGTIDIAELEALEAKPSVMVYHHETGLTDHGTHVQTPPTLEDEIEASIHEGLQGDTHVQQPPEEEAALEAPHVQQPPEEVAMLEEIPDVQRPPTEEELGAESPAHVQIAPEETLSEEEALWAALTDGFEIIGGENAPCELSEEQAEDCLVL